MFALNKLADFHRKGIGREKNISDALELYKGTVDAGQWPANFQIGEIYRTGEGVRIKIQKAFQFKASRTVVDGQEGCCHIHFRIHSRQQSVVGRVTVAFCFDSTAFAPSPFWVNSGECLHQWAARLGRASRQKPSPVAELSDRVTCIAYRRLFITPVFSLRRGLSNASPTTKESSSHKNGLRDTGSSRSRRAHPVSLPRLFTVEEEAPLS